MKLGIVEQLGIMVTMLLYHAMKITIIIMSSLVRLVCSYVAPLKPCMCGGQSVYTHRAVSNSRIIHNPFY